MEQIAQWFNKHNEALGTEEPNEGHADRFGAKLEANKKKKREKKLYLIGLRIAAVFVVLLTAGTIFMKYSLSNGILNTQIANSVVTEMHEVEHYYSSGISQRIEQLKAMEIKGFDIQATGVYDEIAELDRFQQAIVAEFAELKGDERLFSAMITNYQTKLEFLDFVINRLQKSQS